MGISGKPSKNFSERNLSLVWALKPRARSWFKGNDTTSLLIFLEDKLRDEIPRIEDEDVEKYFRDMYETTRSANSFLRTVYYAGFWLSEVECQYLITQGRICLKKFRACAQACFSWNLTRWKLQPKYHMFGEVVYGIEYLYRARSPCPNPLIWSTQLDEDMVGRVCAYSRHVSSRTIHERTLGRYMTALVSKW